MNITVISNGEKKVITSNKKCNLLELLQKNGYAVNAMCGGNGSCGKCKVRVIEGLQSSDGYVLSCKTEVCSDCTVEVYVNTGTGLDYFEDEKVISDKKSGYGIAMDLGTTTIAYSLVSLNDGKISDKITCLNPQSSFGADVISRVKYATKNGVNILQKAVVENIKSTLATFSERHKIREFESMCVAGNTTMLNILLGEDVSGIGQAPFKAKVLECKKCKGLDFGIDNLKELVTLPSQSAFIGGDIIVGAAAVNLEKGKNIIADIGTNGEIVVSNKGKIYCGSTAAGPCFEGANIECGMGGCSGAIDRVFVENGKIRYSTLGGAEPLGICGAGLIDAVAVMLESGVIDSTGAFADGKDKFYLSEKVYITAKDIREFQLAKSAVCSGMEILAERAELNFKDAENVFIAGGLGFYINMENAVKVGLMPHQLKDKIRIVGNTALQGAYMCLINGSMIEKAEKLASKAENIELSELSEFSQKFMENIILEEVLT